MRLRPGKLTFKRAFSEIVMIFIGVTIAISFENWNTDRIEAKRELELLKELEQDLLFNIQELNQKNYVDSLGVYSSKLIYDDLISSNTAYPDSLDRHYAGFYVFRVPGIKRTAFETMKSIGMDIVRNDSIRTLIIDSYDRDMNFIAWCIEWERFEFNDKINPLLDQHIKLKIFGKEAHPIDYGSLKQNKQFANTLNNYAVHKNFRIELIKKRILRIAELNKRVRDEIKRLE